MRENKVSMSSLCALRPPAFGGKQVVFTVENEPGPQPTFEEERVKTGRV